VRRRGVFAEGPRDAVILLDRDHATLRDVVLLQRDRTMPSDSGMFLQEGPRDVVVLMEGTAQSQDCDNPLLTTLPTATILPAAQNFLVTIWPLIEIFRSLLQHRPYY